MKKNRRKNLLSETHRSLARLIFGSFAVQSCHTKWRLADNGTNLLRPIVAERHLKFLQLGSLTKDSSLLIKLRDQLLKQATTISDDLILQRFRKQMMSGELAKIDGFDHFINKKSGVKLIEGQLVGFQIPLIDFLHCLAIYVIGRLEEFEALRRNKKGLLVRTDPSKFRFYTIRPISAVA